jgi:hypothetical protein
MNLIRLNKEILLNHHEFDKIKQSDYFSITMVIHCSGKLNNEIIKLSKLLRLLNIVQEFEDSLTHLIAFLLV